MKKKYQHIDLPPDVQAFRANFIVATEIEGTLGGITFYKMRGGYFARSKSSLTGKRVKRDKKFRRTMHNAAVMALASKYVTPIYNSLTDDWRCHDLCRKLVGLGVKQLHEGKTKEAVQQAVCEELERLGYRTEWPVWELPPNLAEWMEEEQSVRKDSLGGVKSTVPDIVNKKPLHGWVVNEKGELTFVEMAYLHNQSLNSRQDQYNPSLGPAKTVLLSNSS